ncbi:MoeB/ThiF family adenylyltransferase [Pontibacillus yanchengensis]|uniref:Thiamine biosynthesis protein MoeB n=1 Tax=Pontibacillus yanchengensis Y32 TaxID=1385514 RepID=A0A0A2T652_9BACI|nr:MoeB/ThiF family adenylyltransferase [Pontibacillus yanchengensis]KGP70974.1 thiamine biosynthesis protein MoeB [Pontibacillus yanchengensis Y32]
MTDRYSRQTLFSPIGTKGQEKIKQSSILILGLGALGTATAQNLVRGGVGKLTLIDRDVVEYSNLQRQQLFMEADAEENVPKAVAATRELRQMNHQVSIQGIVMDAQREELEPFMKEVDLIIDATDNFDTRLLINDLSQKYNVPWIYGACVGSYGLSFTIIPGVTPCLQCLMDIIPAGGATCDTIGIIAPAVQMVVAHQTAEALKIMVDDKEAMRNQIVSFDIWKNEHSSITVNHLKKDTCSSCGIAATYPFLSQANQSQTAVLCGRDTVQIRPSQRAKINLNQIEEQLKPLGSINKNDYLLSFKPFNDLNRVVIFKDGRVLIHGTDDITKAKKIYSRWIG